MEMKEYLKDKFVITFQEEADCYLSCGGRFELLGNHTDHNHGICLAAACDLIIACAVKKRNDLTVRVLSEGYGYFEISLASLNRVDGETGKFTSIIRGVAHSLAENKFKYGGFDIYIKSNIPNGAGVSSSAAFEMLIGHVYNKLFNKNAIPLMSLCKASLHAEKDYYGKMCGLLDQIGVGYGGLVYIDFKDIGNPEVQQIKVSFNDYQFMIINTGGSHAELSHLYESIPNDMYKVADLFGKGYLRDVGYKDFFDNKTMIIEKCGLLPYQRGEHFFRENERVHQAFEAMKLNDIPKLIKLMNESRKSSTELLQNMYVNKKKGSPLEACELVLKASHRTAGVKINGGGFAGSVIALVPKKEVKNVIRAAKLKYGKNNIHLINIREEGLCELL